MPDEWSTLDQSRANLRACAYNAAVNWGSGRATKKMRDLISAINWNEREEGAAKMEELVALGIIDGYEVCPPECRVFPGGLRHAGGCRNESNSDFVRGIGKRTREELPEGKAARFISIGLVGGRYDEQLVVDDMNAALESQRRLAEQYG